MGVHYLRSLISLFPTRVFDKFKEKKYSFYKFQRKLPNNKYEAYKYQFAVGIVLVAAAGLYRELAFALRATECVEQVFFENIYE